MIRIANWAQKHIAAARLLIAVLHILVFLLAAQLGQILSNAAVSLSLFLLLSVAFAVSFFVTLLGLKRKKYTDQLQRMKIQKARFFLTGLVCTFLLVGMLQHNSLQNKFSLTVQAAFTSKEEKKMPVYEDYADKELFWKDVKTYYHSLPPKELRKVLLYQTKHLSRISDNLETAIAILLVGFAASAALGLIAALSCSLACNGQGALAWLVLIGGWGLIIFLLILAGKAYRKSKKKRAVEKAAEKPVAEPVKENTP